MIKLFKRKNLQLEGKSLEIFTYGDERSLFRKCESPKYSWERLFAEDFSRRLPSWQMIDSIRPPNEFLRDPLFLAIWRKFYKNNGNFSFRLFLIFSHFALVKKYAYLPIVQAVHGFSNGLFITFDTNLESQLV